MEAAERISPAPHPELPTALFGMSSWPENNFSLNSLENASHSEPSGGAGQELPEFGSHMANGFSEADFSEEAFAGLESAIIAETDHSLQTEPGQAEEPEPVFAEASGFRNEMEETEVSRAASAGVTQPEAALGPEVAPEPEETSRQAEQAVQPGMNRLETPTVQPEMNRPETPTVQPGMNRPKASSAAAGASSAVLPAPKPELPKKREYVFPFEIHLILSCRGTAPSRFLCWAPQFPLPPFPG